MPLGSAMSEVGSLPVSVAVRDRNFFKHVTSILLFVLAVIGFVILQNYIPASREFYEVMLFGFLSPSLASWLRWRSSSKSAGAPLVRLTAQRDWLRFLLCASAAAGCYYVGYQLGWTFTWLGYATGIGFGSLAAIALMNLVGQPVDFRENGIAATGRFFWPWTQTRLIVWTIRPAAG
jgi:hypothetical protein